MSLNVGGHNSPRLGEIKTIDLHGRGGVGCYSLFLRLEAVVNRIEEDQTAEISNLVCRLEAADGNTPFSEGSLEGNPERIWHQHSTDECLGFYFYLSKEQVKAMDENRHLDDLRLGVWLSGTIEYKGKRNGFCDKGAFTVPKQKWIDVLGHMGYKDTLLMELPISNIHDGEIKKKLIKAREHIFNGHYQETVGLCRQVIELAQNEKIDKKKLLEARNMYRDNRENMSIDQRILFMGEALKNITQLGNHPTDDSFSRYQAQSVLGMTISLLAVYG